MRRRRILNIELSWLVIGFGILIAGGCSQPSSQGQPHGASLTLPPTPKTPIAYPATALQRPRGGPAIHPVRANEVQAFSSDDVRQFLVSTPAPLGTKGAPGVTISRVDCTLTAGKLSAILLGKNTDLPAELPICYAELSGAFNFSAPPLPRRSQNGTIMTFHIAFRVFDAKTGNLVLTGAFNRPPS